jgi:hypothetical protein
LPDHGAPGTNMSALQQMPHLLRSARHRP